MQKISNILQQIQNVSNSTQKGRLFEALCLYFLKNDKLYQDRFSDAWLWHSWPGSNSHDIGIDIVAKFADSSNFCAVQCKFRQDDSSISKAEIDSFLAASSKEIFSQRIIFALTADFSQNASEALKDQSPPVTVITRESLEASSINWDNFSFSNLDSVTYTHKVLRDYQVSAVKDVINGFTLSDRGKLIMACGTGKTFTSLKIAETLAGSGGLVLVLVPSISLLNQSLLAWNYDHDENITLKSFAICSDSTVGQKDYPDEDMKLSDLAIPPTTNAQDLVNAFTQDTEAMTVIFSTYQSLQVIRDAQSSGLPEFDIAVCDEAHRTAGLTPKDKSESLFRKIHDPSFIAARKRLYMTATPKVFGEHAKSQAKDNDLPLYSMDNPEIYGQEFHRLSFSDAVKADLLADYKVMVFMIERRTPNQPDQEAVIHGVFKALAKNISPADFDFLQEDKQPMRRAVAFSNTINASKDFAHLAAALQADSAQDNLHFQTQHIDGKTPSAKRSAALLWLKDSNDPDTCRILSNARCLCEGVDVPALDAIIFLNPKSSQIDIVQSVGRVMRKAEGKKFGYVILPVIVNPDETPEEALDKNDSYKTVWQVLQALRAHDDHFQAEINYIELNGKQSRKVRITTGGENENGYSNFTDYIAQKYKDAFTVRMVRKCGSREYWHVWVQDLVNAFHEISARITDAIITPSAESAFSKFTQELQSAVNPSIDTKQAVEMLAQHITSKEVFDAIFTGFAEHNPVSRSMQNIRAELESGGADLDPQGLEKFNEHVRDKAAQAETGEAKQKLLREIYENFFSQAFPETAKSLGIVYTPEQIVDFIIRSADWAVKDLLHYPEGLAAKDVHILDPFSGTGTFTARLIESGIIPKGAIARKYRREVICGDGERTAAASEIHANEILLLAYYISALNIEAAYTQVMGGFYKEFPGMVFADTFRMRTDDRQFTILHENGERAAAQESAKINVIIGNPPYSVGKKGGIYEEVDGNITKYYAADSTATNKKSLYDSYIRAIRWATDRIGKKGIICYVSNGSFLDSNSADGMRKSLAKEFTQIYIFNLRGNQRGGDWRKEGEKVFGGGSQCPIAITLFVKDGSGSPCEIRYYDVGDYLTRDGKLEELKGCVSFGVMMRRGMMTELTPNVYGDWLKHRSGQFGGFEGLGSKNKKEEDSPAIFESRYSMGVDTHRDIWCYNFSREALRNNVRTTIWEYNIERKKWRNYRGNERIEDFVTKDSTKISWSRGLLQRAARNEHIAYNDYIVNDAIRVGLYRPYVKTNIYFSREINEYVFQMPRIFPTPDKKNLVICVSGVGNKNFSVLMTDCIPSLDTLSKTQCFPLRWYEEVDSSIFGRQTESRDGVSSAAVARFRARYGDDGISAEDVFYYVYGVLSSREYRERFGEDTRRVLARVPFARVFWEFAEAGRELGRLHVGYESIAVYSGLREEWRSDCVRDYVISKMRDEVRGGERVIRYSDKLTLSGIPSEAWEYVVNGRSALGWVIERYSDSVDVKSGIRNDCNAWAAERGNARYVVELLGRVVSVSCETVRILRSLPELGV